MLEEKYIVDGHYSDKLESGFEVSFERSVYECCENLQDEINEALSKDIQVEKQKLENMEKEIYNAIVEKLKDWEEVAKKIIPYKRAEQYLNDCKLIKGKETTNNEWEVERGCINERHHISNKSYSMDIDIYERTKYVDGKRVPCEWEVSYRLYADGIKKYKIADITSKKFKDKEKAYKYVDGRKKYYSRYFKELYQPIMEEYINCYLSCGKLIKGYKVEE